MNLMKLEMMNGSERLVEALEMRGLFAEIEKDVISLSNKNTKDDIVNVRSLLSSLNIPTMWMAVNKFQVLVNRLPISMMKKIMNATGREFPVHMEGYHFRWRAFAQRRFGIKVNALELDPQVAMMVKQLNFAGITTLAGCNGHHRYSPNFQLSGVFQGAWFSVIQEKYFGNSDFHYKWNVHFGNQSGSSFIAEKEQQENWNMNYIYKDTIQMAMIIQEHANEIRDLKKNLFKRNDEMKQVAERFVEEQDYLGLVAWMKGLVEEKVMSK